MRVLYLTKCANKYSAYEEASCKESILKEDKFSFLEPKRQKAFELYEPNTNVGAGALWRIYKDSFWEGLHMHVMPKTIKERIFERAVVLHPIMGMMSPEDRVCKWDVSCDLKFMGFWKEDLHRYLLSDDYLVFNFLPSSFEKFLPKAVKLVNFKYMIKDRPMKANSLAMAYTMRYILEKDISTLEDFKKINFLDFEVSDIKKEDNKIVVYMSSQGKYSVKKAGII